MKLYLKKDYWFYKEGYYSITYKSNFEKIVKWIIHFVLDRMPVKYFYVGKPKFTPLKQIAYQPTIRRNTSGIQAVLPYHNENLWGLFRELQAQWELDKAEYFSADFHPLPIDVHLRNMVNADIKAIKISPWQRFKLRREWLKKIKKGY